MRWQGASRVAEGRLGAKLRAMRPLRLRSFAILLSAATFVLSSCDAGPDDDVPGPDTENPNGDNDGDTIKNADDGSADADGDGKANLNDTDSDGDGWNDEVEAGDDDLDTPPADSDMDGTPDFLDEDSDQNGILDANDDYGGDVDQDGKLNAVDPDDDGDGIVDSDELEGATTVDTDGDGTPDYHDIDADNDGINDSVEGLADTDGDGSPNFVDLDSDNDGFTDQEEGTADAESDGTPNYLDLDSDNDGLPDTTEAQWGTDPTNADTDGDGDSDLVEVVLHEVCVEDPDACNGDPDPLDPDVGVSPEDFVFVLPYEDPEQDRDLDFETKVRKADIHFSVDVTYSMSEEIQNMKNGITGVINQVSDPVNGIPDSAFGVSRFADFPISPYGESVDDPYELLQRITTIPSEALSGVNQLALQSGGDTPESNYEGLFQAASGIGLAGWVPPYDPMVGYDPAKHGLIGGAGFRAGALPMIIEVTDARAHTNQNNVVLTCEGGFTMPLQYTTGSIPGVHGEYQATAVSQANGIRVMGLASNSEPVTSACNPRGHLVPLAEATGALVPPEAFTDGFGNRPAGCAADQCCTGVDGIGRAPNASGQCPLVFDVNANGSGSFSSLIVTAVRALTQFARLDVSAETNSDQQMAADGTLIDPAQFITGITAVSLTPEPDEGTQIDPATQTFLDVLPGAIAKFNVSAQNTFLPEAPQTQVFTLKIDVVGDQVTVLDQRQVVIIVPAKFSDIQ